MLTVMNEDVVAAKPVRFNPSAAKPCIYLKSCYHSGEDPFILLKSGVRFATFRAIPQIRPDMSLSPLPLTRPPLRDNIGTSMNGSPDPTG